MADYESANFDDIEFTVINEVIEDIMITLMIIISMEETCTVDNDGLVPTLSCGDEDSTSLFEPTIVNGPDGDGSESIEKVEAVPAEDRELRNSSEDLVSVPDPEPTKLQEPLAAKRQRSRFSSAWSGVKRASFYSICPKVLASYMAKKCGNIKVAVDPFCGAGGNVIQLAKMFDKVIAMDIDPEKILLAKHNSIIYEVFDKIEFIIGDFFTMANQIKGDVIVTSPPWGGPDYNETPVIGPLQLSLDKILAIGKTVAPKVLLHLPKNIDKFECLKMCNGIGSEVRKVENVFMDRYLNSTLLYVRSNN
ncbi:hypothetical protein QTP88_013008 [Uroleucon formosanum]